MSIYKWYIGIIQLIAEFCYRFDNLINAHKTVSFSSNLININN